MHNRLMRVCVLAHALRQRGGRGGQRRGEGQRSAPAHHRQSADAFRAVAQAGAALGMSSETQATD